MPKKKRARNKLPIVKTGNIFNISWNVNVAGANITMH
jgi:hypothetical protein